MDESVGLKDVYSENLDEMSDEGDYEAGEEEDEDEDGIEEEEDEMGEEAGQVAEGQYEMQNMPGSDLNTYVGLLVESARGKKRKLEDGDGN